MRSYLSPSVSPISLATIGLAVANDNRLGCQDLIVSSSNRTRLEPKGSFLEDDGPSYTSSKFLSATNITDYVVNTTAISVEDLGSISLQDFLFGEASFDDLLIYLRPDDEYVPLEAIDCLLEGASPAVGMKTEYVLGGRPIPSFEVAIPNEKGLQLPAKYLKWAYDVLSKGWKAFSTLRHYGTDGFRTGREGHEMEGYGRDQFYPNSKTICIGAGQVEQ
ncbi:hypothetical protein GNI_000360 [Gregarina niphandrodes]|uniref:Uncharacterized protein n=1 Tax=Gregarina niphandrodes TaxID=110365 RepID=A0A023BDP3_GRENI|nr:hypothetical protein GNI_000360 [Gregarina niphandrodes]EZG89731.1 hypothetical protein GNI_000360 [Gregarina niphandrodes]|eukprot:XP_011128439.1 hypothetical protein GNI_000360 [Gregarina niphandrodes]